MKVFITGGTGLVGRNVVERLSGFYQIYAPSRAELNLLDPVATRMYVEHLSPDIVIHCAGTVGGIQANIKAPAKFFIDNVEIGKNVILASAQAGVRRLINLGSSCMYPRSALNPLREEFILTGELEPTNEGYALAKIATQRLCAYLGTENPDLKYKTLLPCNLYGRWDKFDPAHSHLVPAAIYKIHKAKAEGLAYVPIWGSGQARREFMYAGDLADCIASCIERFDEVPSLMNVGLGFDYTVNEYYRTIASVVGYEGDFRHDETKPEGMARKLVDISRLEAFGWGARTSLEEGIKLTYNHFLCQESSR